MKKNNRKTAVILLIVLVIFLVVSIFLRLSGIAFTVRRNKK